MKNKLLLTILTAIFISQTFADNFNNKGLISGRKFTPIQVGIGFSEPQQLFDTNSFALFSLGFFGIKQRSSIISLGTLSEICNNYGCQFSLLNTIGNVNYGISFGLCNSWKKNHGVQIGIINNPKAIWGWGDKRPCGLLNINIANSFQFGILNIARHNIYQIGIFNVAEGSDRIFQLGLLNYNPKSYIPWLPLVNWDMGREEK